MEGHRRSLELPTASAEAGWAMRATVGHRSQEVASADTSTMRAAFLPPLPPQCQSFSRWTAQLSMAPVTTACDSSVPWGLKAVDRPVLSVDPALSVAVLHAVTLPLSRGLASSSDCLPLTLVPFASQTPGFKLPPKIAHLERNGTGNRM